jgi:hypothetical protein
MATKVNIKGITEIDFNSSVVATVSQGVVTLDLSALAVPWSTLTGTLANGQVIPYADAGISRLGVSSLALGNGVAGDFTGSLKLTTLNTVTGIQINGAATTGHVLRGNGTNFVDAQLAYSDLSGTPTVNTWAGLTGTLSNSQVIPYGDAGISRLGAASLAIGNGTAGDVSGELSLAQVVQTWAPTVNNSVGISGAMTGASAAITTIVGKFNNNKPSTDASSNTSGSIGLQCSSSGTSSNASSRNFGAQFGAYGAISNIGFTTFAWDNTTDNTTCIGLYSTGFANDHSSVGCAGYFRMNNTAAIFSGGLGENSTITADNGTQTAVNLLTLKQNGTNVGCIKGDGTYAWGTGTGDSGISRLGAASLAIGNGTLGDKTGNLSYNRINTAGADHAGQATVTAGNTTQAVSFAVNYTGTGQPVIVVTPTSDPLALGVPVGYWVTYSGSAGAWSGFTVNIQTALAGNVTFNYVVIGQA